MVRQQSATSSWARAAALSSVFFVALLVATPLVGQQAGQIGVRIVNGQTGEPIPQVQVTVQNTGIGGLTDNQGRLTLRNVPVGAHTLVAQLIGFGEERARVTVAADQIATVQMRMSSRAVELEGLVVTGTAIAAQRREVGNSISLITADQIRNAAALNFEDILRGRALGVSVSGTSSTPGAASEIVLRGVQSVNGRNDPLIYIDGVRMPAGQAENNNGAANEHAGFLGGINPEDIERIEIIKGAAASTLYGTEASAGVIQIFTKKGQVGAPRWTLSVKQGLSRVGHLGPEFDPTGLHVNDCTRSFVFDSTTLTHSLQDLREPGCPSSGSWLRDGHVQDYQLSARGGAGDVSYYVSGGWNNSQGVVAPQNAKQLSLRGNFTFTGLKNLTLTINNSYSRRDIRWIPNGDSDRGLLFNVTRGAQGDTPDNDDSKVLEMELDQFINQFNTSGNINWQQRDNLRHRLNLGLDYSNSHYITELPWLYFDEPEGHRDTDVENRRLFTLDYAGSWNVALSSAFSSTLSWGGQYNQNEHLGLRGDADIFFGPGDKVLQNGEEFFAQEDRDVTEGGGFFLQEQIGWKNRFFVTAGLRADTHSNFGADYTRHNQFTYYPKLQATYSISDHSFWPNWWETFRLRAAYGESGEPPGFDDAVTLFQVAGADENRLGYIIINQGNPNIGPERSKEIEGGFDASLFNGRLSLTATGYNQKTFDGRIFVNPPPSNGIAETVPLNAGSWRSRGIETAADVVAYDGDRLRLAFNSRYQYTDSKMLNLGDPEEEALGGFGFNYLNRYRTGAPLPALFGRKVTNIDSVGQLPIYTAQDTFLYGPSRPPHEASVGTAVTVFNRLTFEAFGVAQWGHVLYDDMAQELAEIGLWPECQVIDARVRAADFADIPTRMIAKCARPYVENEDWFEKANYFRLQSATMSYRLPERLLRFGLTGATVQFQATNLFTITNFSGLYPDALLYPLGQTARGNGYLIPPARTYTLNVRMNF